MHMPHAHAHAHPTPAQAATLSVEIQRAFRFKMLMLLLLQQMTTLALALTICAEVPSPPPSHHLLPAPCPSPLRAPLHPYSTHLSHLTSLYDSYSAADRFPRCEIRSFAPYPRGCGRSLPPVKSRRGTPSAPLSAPNPHTPRGLGTWGRRICICSTWNLL